MDAPQPQGSGESIGAVGAQTTASLREKIVSFLEDGRFADFVRQEMQTYQVPGLALGVIHQHQLIYTQGFGVTSAEAENALPITPDTLFRVGSVTKPLTGTMLMRLVQQGLLQLDTPIAEYLSAPTDDFRSLAVDGKNAVPTSPETVAAQYIAPLPSAYQHISLQPEQITLRMLLSHTSGLPSDLEYVDRRMTRPYPTDLAQYVAERIPQYPQVAPPGKVYFYSNPSINLAARLAEIVTGKPYPKLMREHVFEPLGMTRTTFKLAEALTYPLAQGHILNDGGQPQVKRPFIDSPMEYPCGFAMTTVHDLARFVQAHLTDTTLREMHTTQVDRLNGEGYGLTFRTRTYQGVPLVGHNGAIGKFGAVLVMSVEQGCGVVLMFNRAPGFWGSASTVTSRVLDAILTPSLHQDQTMADGKNAVPTISGDVGARFFVSDAQTPDLKNGFYLGYNTGLVEVTADTVTINGKQVDDAVIGWVDDDYLMVNGLPCQRFSHTPITLAADELARYVGVYEADIDTWRVRSDGTILSIYSEDDREEVICIPLTAQRFACDWGVIDFEWHDGGVTALVSALAYRFTRIGLSSL